MSRTVVVRCAGELDRREDEDDVLGGRGQWSWRLSPIRFNLAIWGRLVVGDFLEQEGKRDASVSACMIDGSTQAAISHSKQCKLLLLLYEVILPFHRCSGGHLHMNFHTGDEKLLFFVFFASTLFLFVDKVS